MTIGFIGAGNMAGAIIKGAVQTDAIHREQIHVCDIDALKLDALSRELGVIQHDSISPLLSAADIVVLAVKPQQILAVLEGHHKNFSDKAVVSIAAGWTTQMLKSALPKDARVLRVMPNTPALVGEGMTALSMQTDLSDAEKRQAEQLFLSLGRAAWVEESKMEAVIGVSGSGPAYAYLFIEAMADAGVSLGLARDQALEMAAQTLLGASKMVLETGMHPGALKDMVCSPGGTTIQAVRSLEQSGFRGSVMGAVIAAADKAAAMHK